MLTMAVAAVSFAACNKQETTPVKDNQLGNKSIVMNLSNLGATKSAGTQLDAGQVALKNFQVFFSDGTYLYAPKTATAEEFTEADDWGTYFEATAGSEQEFHFLENAVSQVIVLGNLPAPIAPNTYATKDALLEAYKTKAIADQQDASELALYGVDYTLEETEEHDSYQDQHPKPVLKAEVELTPIVARFEVTGFKYSENPNQAEATETTPEVPARAYDKMKVENLSMTNFYTTATVALETETVVKAAISGTEGTYFGLKWDANNIYQQYFMAEGNTIKGTKFWDTIGAELSTTNFVYPAVAEGATNTACHYYHIFADPAKVNPTAVPTFNVQLTAEKTNAADETTTSLLYLQTRSIKNGTTPLTASTIEAGKIYRMEFDFNDTVLQAAEKCIDVVVTVAEWEVVPVTPSFN